MSFETMELIEQALDATLCELRKVKDAPAKKVKCAYSTAYWTEDEWSHESERVHSLKEIVTAPLKYSLLRQLHQIGWLIFDEFRSTEKMREVAEWVAALDVENYEFRINALDSAFVGVGRGDDVWQH